MMFYGKKVARTETGDKSANSKDQRCPDRDGDHSLVQRTELLSGKDTGTQAVRQYGNVLPCTHTRTHTHDVHCSKATDVPLSYVWALESTFDDNVPRVTPNS